MKYLLVLFLSVSSAYILMSSQWGIDNEFSLYSCSPNKFPTGGPFPFISCSSTNPLVDVECAGCHGQNPQMDGGGNIIAYENIVDGTSMNVFKVMNGATQVTEYVPGQEYTLELNMNTSAIRKGFDVTICSNTGDDGSFEQIPTEIGAQVVNDLNFIYATHTDNIGTDTWKWKWVAPSVDPGPLTFYILTLKDNGNPSGDDSLYISNIQMNPENAAITAQTLFENRINCWMDNDNRNLILQFEGAKELPIIVDIFSVSGEKVMSKGVTLISNSLKEICLSSTIDSGVYIVRLSNVQGVSKTRKIYIH